ncbi:MAG TPA: hypothetical protein DCY94_01530 [Firmicutes bacterium]|nr:hypothetical protein [Bacillota bacterium]
MAVYGILIVEKKELVDMHSRKIKILLTIVLLIFVVAVIRGNITIKKEPAGVIVDNNSMQLEVNSETVKSAYNKLRLLDIGSFDDEVYDNMDFNMEEDTKELSADEKLFLVFEYLYGEEAFEKEESTEENTEVLKVELSVVKDKYESMFKEELIPEEIKYKTSSKRGIIGLTLEDNKYILKFRKGETSRKKRARIISAVKTGDYINLKIKAFYATKTSSFEGSELIYKIKNFGENKIIIKEPESRLDGKEIFENKNIYNNTFSFELSGEDYYLRTIKRDI